MIRLFTGGSGLLGQELEYYFKDDFFPSSAEFNVHDYDGMEKYLTRCNEKIDMIVHLAAETTTKEIETKDYYRRKAIQTNIVGTANIVQLCMDRNIKLIYISTDYVFDGEKGDYVEDDNLNPINKYAWSKLGGEASVRLYDNSLIVRMSFCADRFPYPKAFADQLSTRMPVSQAGFKLKDLINENPSGIRHLFSTKQTIYQLAKNISPNKEIEPISINDIEDYKLPKDTSLSTKYGEENE
jgi:dTDP-4-dehydrorhamnose reductase